MDVAGEYKLTRSKESCCPQRNVHVRSTGPVHVVEYAWVQAAVEQYTWAEKGVDVALLGHW